jgi:hypothetical protein
MPEASSEKSAAKTMKSAFAAKADTRNLTPETLVIVLFGT